MNASTPGDFAERYLGGLRARLEADHTAGRGAGFELGGEAVALGLEAVDLAWLHDPALAALIPADASPAKREDLAARAALFFAEAISVIGSTHPATPASAVAPGRRNRKVDRRALALADSKPEPREKVGEPPNRSEISSRLLLGRSLAMQEQLRDLSRQLLTVQEEERRRISRELHDVVAQTLAGINVRLAALNAESGSNKERLHKKIESTRRLVERSVEIVHRFARELRPTVLDDLGLIPALELLMKGFIAETGVRVTLKAFARIEDCDSGTRTVLYRIVQEALANVARHAGASRADVTIRSLDGTIAMEIADDGKGFEAEGAPWPGNPGRIGLLGMRERIGMIGGSLQVESAPGGPTTIRVEIPPDRGSLKIAGKSRPNEPHTSEVQ